MFSNLVIFSGRTAGSEEFLTGWFRLYRKLNHGKK